MITNKPFGVTSDGNTVSMYTISNRNGMSIEVLDYGCTLHGVRIPCNGSILDVCLGYDTLEEYIHNATYLGAVCGRFANRIAKGQFTLNRVTYQLPINNGVNHLHGGDQGFSTKLYAVDSIDDRSITFFRKSPDGEEGYPGNLNFWVTYTLDDNNTFRIDYRADSDKDTILNLTNHAYWNLNGHDARNAMDQYVMIPASYFCPTDDTGMTTGEIKATAGTPFDFKDLKQIRPQIEQKFIDLDLGHGFDHCFLLDGQKPVILKGNQSGITLTIETDFPGVHFYTANYLEDHPGKNGARYQSRSGVCLETEQVPDAPNQPQFPSAVLKANEPFHSYTTYHFSM